MLKSFELKLNHLEFYRVRVKKIFALLSKKLRCDDDL
jgi:hypothetical protein